MPYPPAPDLSYSYTAAEQALGDGSLPGQELDVDLGALRAAIAETIEFLKVTHRSDGKLANGSVTEDALGASIRIGFEPPAPWSGPGTAYTTRSTAFFGFGFYLCTIAHTSAAAFSTDLNAGRWLLLADLTPPGGALIASNNLSDVPDKAAGRAALELQSMAQAVAGTGGTEFRNNNQNDSRFVQNLSGLSITATAAQINNASRHRQLAQGTLSGSELILEIASDIDAVDFEYDAFVPSVNGGQLLTQLGTGTIGSPVWQTSNYAFQALNVIGTSVTGSSGTGSNFGISTTQSNSASFAGHGQTRISGFNRSGFASFLSSVGGVNTAPSRVLGHASGWQEDTATRTLMRVFVASGTMAGAYRLFGYAKP